MSIADRTLTLGTAAIPGNVIFITTAPPTKRTTVIHALGTTVLGCYASASFVAMPAFSRLPGEGEDEPVPCVFVPKVADHE